MNNSLNADGVTNLIVVK